MTVSLAGFTIIRTAALNGLRAQARAARAAPQSAGPTTMCADSPGGADGPPPIVREVIRVADGLLNLTGSGAAPDPQRADTVLRWIEARTRSLLAACDVVRIEEAGDFDPLRHEAVASRTAPDPDLAHQIADTIRPGYAWHGRLLRPQQVTVYVPAGTATSS
jgi:hypothetical protein